MSILSPDFPKHFGYNKSKRHHGKNKQPLNTKTLDCITSSSLTSAVSFQSILPFLRQLLFNRGITTAETARAYLRGIPTDTNPFALKDMDKAVEIIHNAIESNQNIAIYGDYDTDGVTSSALLYEFFDQLGNTPRVYIPNRFDEGYGLNIEAIQQLATEGIDLIITVDCGIRAQQEVALPNNWECG